MNGLTAYALSKKYTEDSLMGAGALKGEKGENGLSIKALSITQDDTGKIVEATATLSDNTTLKVDVITEEERLEGDGAEYYTLAPTPLSFRSDAPLNELQDVQINGVTVDPSNYTLEEGSTIVTFPIDYLKTLEVGNYEVTVASESKSVKGGFTVAAPELNEHGFYYNQPYAAYMDYFGSDVVMFIRENNTMDVMVVANGIIETATYAVDGGTLTITSPSMGELHCTFSVDGMELYNTELGATLSLNENETYAADKDYIYIYKEDLGGYEVTAINKTQSEYGAIKMGINGIDTVSIGERAFVDYSIGTFGGNPNITNFAIRKGITTIGKNAFCGCESLISIIFPTSITTICEYVFWGCNSLESIIYEGSVEEWNKIQLSGDWNLYIPATYVQCSDGTVEL